MFTIGVISLGCAKNQVDTERMLGLLTEAGHSITSNPAEADVLIVNTCGFHRKRQAGVHRRHTGNGAV